MAPRKSDHRRVRRSWSVPTAGRSRLRGWFKPRWFYRPGNIWVWRWQSYSELAEWHRRQQQRSHSALSKGYAARSVACHQKCTTDNVAPARVSVVPGTSSMRGARFCAWIGVDATGTRTISPAIIMRAIVACAVGIYAAMILLLALHLPCCGGQCAAWT
jgi:hypothetical protein